MKATMVEGAWILERVCEHDEDCEYPRNKHVSSLEPVKLIEVKGAVSGIL